MDIPSRDTSASVACKVQNHGEQEQVVKISSSWRTTLLIATMAALIPATVPARGQHGSHAPRALPGEFDYYVMSLSWAPSFCASHPGESEECSKPHGFVLHGLWPQYDAGGYPQICSGRLLNDQEREAAAKVFPSEQLAAHEWSKHGTCSGLEPTGYFDAAASARDSIQIPEQLHPGDRTLKMRASDIVRAIRDSNPALPAKAVTVSCGGKSLTEVRFCLDKSFTVRACGPDVKNSCGAGPVSVPGAR